MAHLLYDRRCFKRFYMCRLTIIPILQVKKLRHEMGQALNPSSLALWLVLVTTKLYCLLLCPVLT